MKFLIFDFVVFNKVLTRKYLLWQVICGLDFQVRKTLCNNFCPKKLSQNFWFEVFLSLKVFFLTFPFQNYWFQIFLAKIFGVKFFLTLNFDTYEVFLFNMFEQTFIFGRNFWFNIRPFQIFATKILLMWYAYTIPYAYHNCFYSHILGTFHLLRHIKLII